MFEKQPHVHRCGARTRAGKSCQGLRVKRADGSFAPRCRLHGCGPGSGARKGNQNAYRHGYFTAESKNHRQEIRNLLNDFKDFNALILEENQHEKQ